MATRRKARVSVMDAIIKASNRADSFINQVTGKGVPGVDKTIGSGYSSRAAFQTEFLDQLYSGDSFAALVCDVKPDEAMRQGFTVKTGDPDEDSEMATKLRNLGARAALADADRWGFLYGEAAVIVGTVGGGPLHRPLNHGSVRDVVSLRVVSRDEYNPHTFDEFGETETYLVTPKTVGGTVLPKVIHRDRMIRFGGVKTTKQRKTENNGFDDSILQRIYDSLESYDDVFNNIQTLLADGNQAVFKMSGLANAIAAEDEGSDAIKKRFQLMNLARSTHRALVLDAGDSVDPAEEFTRQAANFTGLADLVDKFMLHVSSVTRIPVTILMGQSPAGMNSTGESDFRGWYNTIESHQTNRVEPRLLKLVELIRGSQDWTATSEPGTATVDWPSLWTPTDKEIAETRKIQAETDSIRIADGVLTAEEVTLSRYTAEGYSNEVSIDAAGRAAREQSLADALEDLTEPEPEPTPPTDREPDPEVAEDDDPTDIQQSSTEPSEDQAEDPEQDETTGSEPETG